LKSEEMPALAVRSPAGVAPVDAGPETCSRDDMVEVEVVEVRRGAVGGTAFSAACAAATLDATDIALITGSSS